MERRAQRHRRTLRRVDVRGGGAQCVVGCLAVGLVAREAAFHSKGCGTDSLRGPRRRGYAVEGSSRGPASEAETQTQTTIVVTKIILPPMGLDIVVLAIQMAKLPIISALLHYTLER